MKLFFFPRHDLKKGIFLVLIAWLCFATLYMVSKLLDTQTTVPTMLFFRNVFGFCAVLPWIFKQYPKSIEVKNVKIVVLRSLMGLLNLFFIFLAVDRISLVNTTLLNNSAPFFVPFIVWFWLKKDINSKIWPAIVVGFIGIALILQPNRRIFNLGAVYALLSGVCLAITIITMRLTTKKEKLLTFLFYFFTIGVVVTLPFAIAYWKVENMGTLIGLLSIGLLSATGQVFLFHGLKFAKAHVLAPFAYSTVIFSGIYEWLIWGNTPTPIAYIGTILIIAAGGWIAWIGRVTKQD